MEKFKWLTDKCEAMIQVTFVVGMRRRVCGITSARSCDPLSERARTKSQDLHEVFVQVIGFPLDSVGRLIWGLRMA